MRIYNCVFLICILGFLKSSINFCQYLNDDKINLRIELVNTDLLLSSQHLKKEKNILSNGKKINIKVFEKIRSNVLERAFIISEINMLKDNNESEDDIPSLINDDTETNKNDSENDDSNTGKIKVISSEESEENNVHMIRKVYHKISEGHETTYCYMMYTFNLDLDKLNENSKNDIFKSLDQIPDYISFLPRNMKLSDTEEVLERENQNNEENTENNLNGLSALELTQNNKDVIIDVAKYIHTFDDLINFLIYSNNSSVLDNLKKEREFLYTIESTENGEQRFNGDFWQEKEKIETYYLYEVLTTLKNIYFQAKVIDRNTTDDILFMERDAGIIVKEYQMKKNNQIVLNRLVEKALKCHELLKKTDIIDYFILKKIEENENTKVHEVNIKNHELHSENVLEENNIEDAKIIDKCASYFKLILNNEYNPNNSYDNLKNKLKNIQLNNNEEEEEEEEEDLSYVPKKETQNLWERIVESMRKEKNESITNENTDNKIEDRDINIPDYIYYDTDNADFDVPKVEEIVQEEQEEEKIGKHIESEEEKKLDEEIENEFLSEDGVAHNLYLKSIQGFSELSSEEQFLDKEDDGEIDEEDDGEIDEDDGEIDEEDDGEIDEEDDGEVDEEDDGEDEEEEYEDEEEGEEEEYEEEDEEDEEDEEEDDKKNSNSNNKKPSKMGFMKMLKHNAKKGAMKLMNSAKDIALDHGKIIVKDLTERLKDKFMGSDKTKKSEKKKVKKNRSINKKLNNNKGNDKQKMKFATKKAALGNQRNIVLNSTNNLGSSKMMNQNKKKTHKIIKTKGRNAKVLKNSLPKKIMNGTNLKKSSLRLRKTGKNSSMIALSQETNRSIKDSSKKEIKKKIKQINKEYKQLKSERKELKEQLKTPTISDESIIAQFENYENSSESNTNVI